MSRRCAVWACGLLVGVTTALAAQGAAPGQASVAVTEKDVAVAHRAREILASKEAWNQTDRQDCNPAAKTFGLYCALMKAQRDVTGSDSHDAAVMDGARDIIDFVTAKTYNARLVNYNNDPDTTFVDIQAFLHFLENRLRRQLGSTPAAAPAASASSAITCQFARQGDRWNGPCGPIAGEHPIFALGHAAAITTGAWRADAKPEGVWSDANASAGDAPLELEIYAGGTGVLRTPWGWFPVTAFHADPLSFTVDGEHEVAPNEVDRRILQRAAAILSSDAVWNRHDDRSCPAGAKTWSIYCAVEQASVDLLGAYHHRRPAAELVRDLIDERTKDRNYNHRLMDYNNDVRTQLADVKTLFAEAIARIK